ncbi:3-hydroxyacyl-CoA dehydrogenase family protein [Xanthobacter autotrophicus]|uniref:3-hydroxyacyl-CoA dehydrogenase family protein n=1 Tax=Xanthobacter autotrophicus TaxID=280 RepID=UPI0037270E2A
MPEVERRRTVAVVGCGTMGIGIAIVAARGGWHTLLHDADAGRIGRARDDAAAFLARSVKLNRLSEEAAASALDRLRPAPVTEDLADADLVIEAVFEDEKVKAGVIGKLDAVCPEETVLATNTSTLSVTRLAAAGRRPERFVGMHFCLPAQLMKLVEVTRGLRTADAAFATAWDFCVSTGQAPVETKDTPGFILNHFVIPLNNRAIRMVEEKVASAADIDRAVKSAYGHPLGPLELVDLVGLDTQERLCDAFYPVSYDPELACPSLVRQMVAAGWLGKKAGRGFYTYQNDKTFGA